MRTTNPVATLVLLLLCVTWGSPLWAQEDDTAGVRNKRYRLEKNPKLQYELIGAAEDAKTPEDGYKLLVVLPGGDGSAEFTPFVKRIWQYSLDEEYLVVQLIAPKWSPKQPVVWPTKKNRAKGMKMPTEQFIAKAVEDVGKRTKLNPQHIFALAWSSGGPAAYAASATPESPLRGVLAAMSVYKPETMPALEGVKDKAYYLLHSPDDRVCPFRMAEQGASELKEQGAKTSLVTYEGGHGWQGDVFGNISQGVEWLEENSTKPGEK